MLKPYCDKLRKKSSICSVIMAFPGHLLYKIGFDILCKLSPEDNVHKMSKPILWKK